MQKSLTFVYKDKNYPLLITYKRIKNVIYRFDGSLFKASAPYGTSDSYIVKHLFKYIDKMLKRYQVAEEPFTNDHIYLFGKKVSVTPSGGNINFTDGSTLKYLDLEDLFDKVQRIYLDMMIKRTRYYEMRMRIEEPYKVKIKKMHSRYGSNSSRTHSIQYADNLYCYSIDILDSLVVHELAHHFVRKHDKAFYDVVYKYCPNYKNDNRKLKKRIYQ